MDYQQSLAFMQDLCKFGVNPGLQRIRELLRRLGDPQESIGHYLHVGGTNGKGSTAAYCESVLRASGRRTGFFSSPHLICHRERYRLDGRWLSEQDFAASISEIAPHITAMVAEGWESPTEFELATACALLSFARAKVDWAVLEVGMGGSIDSTNIIDGDIVIMTNVALDHCRYLGNTVPEIAQVKAGIIKKGSQVVCGVSGEGEEAVRRAAAACRAPVYWLGRDIAVEQVRSDSLGSRFHWRMGEDRLEDLAISMPGLYQVDNAALAAAACRLAGCGSRAIRQGLQSAKWPGRLEIAGQRPLIVLDGAHNPHGMAALTASLQALWPDRRKIALVGMLDDKDRQAALALLAPLLGGAVVTPPPMTQRSEDWRATARYLSGLGVPVLAMEDNRRALQAALAWTEPEDMLLVTGSLYLLGEIRRWLPVKTDKEENVCPIG
ncbi:MAG: bifunctional folylpolyglutamate synthase/dihydrofolate synthase [Firmicutes bacterium]|nr:bifunctional folylpolyglutamate synthase/dihydrofolate synthase [Bacillota bacterium]